MADRLTGKVALVTGAGSQGPGIGNGKATSILFAREGAKVVCVDQVIERAAETVATIESEGGTAVAVAADVTNRGDCEQMVGVAIEKYGRLDILHNNVGVGARQAIREVTEDEWDRVMRVNLKSIVFSTQAAIPHMEAVGGGSIINIASIAALAANYPTVAYKTTKAGMIAYTEQIACQNAEYGVRCNTILPGLMDTPMAVDTRARTWGKTRAEVAAMRDAKVPLRRRMGTAWDVANAALFLASDEANFITGIALPVDGGSSLRKE
jgi:NAD(P)-dependent dehydrogenase (short-subunit alcohol dehydrogenase family)